MEGYPQVVQKRRSFLSTLALGTSLCVITLTVSCAGIILYGMRIVDTKSDDLVGFVKQVVQELPELRKSLPPVLADVLERSQRNEERQRQQRARDQRRPHRTRRAGDRRQDRHRDHQPREQHQRCPHGPSPYVQARGERTRNGGTLMPVLSLCRAGFASRATSSSWYSEYAHPVSRIVRVTSGDHALQWRRRVFAAPA